MNYLKIQPINFGELQEKKANAITWRVSELMLGATQAIAYCNLIWVNDDGGSIEAGYSFQVTIDNNTLQAWGSDDSVINNIVLSYSPLFIVA